MNECLKKHYERLKLEPCVLCGAYGVDVAHLTPYSPKAKTWVARSHKGWRGFIAIPLCRSCHDRVHEIGEDAALSSVGIDRVYALAASYIAATALECGNG